MKNLVIFSVEERWTKMSDFGVKETQCTRCVHREVCSMKTEFLELMKYT